MTIEKNTLSEDMTRLYSCDMVKCKHDEFARIDCMKLIIGLGNYGKEYEFTRHNAGFMVVKRLLEKLKRRANFKTEKKFRADVVRVGDIILAKPLTYMNESGRAVRALLDFYKIDTSDLVVIHDDLDIKLGEYKVQRGVGPKIHNGLSSVEKYLKTKDFLRVRIGVDSRKEGVKYGSGANYVLSRMTKDELERLKMATELSLGDLAIALGLEFE